MSNNNELWVNIPGYEGFYQASNMGRIRSLSRFYKFKNRRVLSIGMVMSQKIGRGGYMNIELSSNGIPKSFAVHRLIMLTFSGESNLFVNHIDLDKKNNKIDNLEYVTARENVVHYHENTSTNNLPTGVCQKSKNSFRAAIYVDNKTLYLGSRKTAIEAGLLYRKAFQKALQGIHPITGNPIENKYMNSDLSNL